MNGSREIATAEVSDQSELLALFGPPALFEGEDAAAYGALLKRVSEAIKPSDIIEDFWIRDIVDLTWQVLRLRRLSSSLLTTASATGVEMVMGSILRSGSAAAVAHLPNVEDVPPSILAGSDARELAEKWPGRDPDVVKEVEELLASAGLTMEAVMAQTLAANIDLVEQIDRMTMSAEVRRNAALKEIDRHRTTLGEKLRRAIQDVETADFEVIAPQVKSRNAA